MYNGQIKSKGPRYCSSIVDKIYRYADKERHRIFVEPEGWNTIETYGNGLGTSLPENVQLNMFRAFNGFEKVKMRSLGYAFEYDYFPPT